MSTETKQALEQAAQATVADLAGTAVANPPAEQATDAVSTETADEFAELPNLFESQVIPLDLTRGAYWTPESPGEAKLVFFRGIDTIEIEDTQNVDEDTGEVPTKQLKLVRFVEQYKDEKSGEVMNRKICNGSVRLVLFFEDEHTLKPNYSINDAFRVVYNGKEKNKKNGFSSARWSVYPIRIAAKANG